MASALEGREFLEDLGIFRESADVAFAEDHLAVDFDVEDASAASDQLDFSVVLFSNGGLQTGGAGEVVSNPAVLDSDFHQNSFVRVDGVGQRPQDRERTAEPSPVSM